jgi:plastocyanin
VSAISDSARTRSIAGAIIVALVVLGGCGGSSYSSGTATTGAGAVAATTVAGSANTLTIKGHAFSALTVKAGDTISIVNADSVDHTVTADDGTFDVAVPAGTTTTLVISKAGTYAIHCKIHASMHGTIVVT